MKPSEFPQLSQREAIDRLARDYRELAPQVAARANQIDDAGSCNHDYCYVRFGDRKLKRLLDATPEANYFRYRYSRGYELPVPGVMGQGSRVAFAATELARLLRERGHEAWVFCTVD